MEEIDWISLIGGGFAFVEAPFAVHSLDKDRAREYRKQAKAASLTWEDVQGHLTAYLDGKSISDAGRAQQMEWARKFFKGHF